MWFEFNSIDMLSTNTVNKSAHKYSIAIAEQCKILPIYNTSTTFSFSV